MEQIKRNQEGIEINQEEIERNQEEIEINQEEIERNQEEIRRNQEEIKRNQEEIRRIREGIQRNQEGIERIREGIERYQEEFERSLEEIERNLQEIRRERINENDNEMYNILNQLPVTTIEDTKRLNDENKKCVICLEDFKNFDKSIYLPCIHLFHEKCITDWVNTKKEFCPVCRTKISNTI